MEGLLCVRHYGRPVLIHFPILPAADSPSRTNVLSPPALLLHSSSIAQLSGAGWPEKTQWEVSGGREPGLRASKGSPCWLSALHTELAWFHDGLTLSPLLLSCAATSAGIPPSHCLAALPFRFQFSCHSLIPTLA